MAELGCLRGLVSVVMGRLGWGCDGIQLGRLVFTLLREGGSTLEVTYSNGVGGAFGGGELDMALMACEPLIFYIYETAQHHIKQCSQGCQITKLLFCSKLSFPTGPGDEAPFSYL